MAGGLQKKKREPVVKAPSNKVLPGKKKKRAVPLPKMAGY